MMEELESLINDNIDDYPDFGDVLVPIEEMQDSKASNDTKLDCSKCVIEGVAKNIVKGLDSSADLGRLDKLSFTKVTECALSLIADRTEEFEQGFVQEMLNPINRLAIIRNKRGEVSHGHVSPKEYSSDGFTDLIIQYSESTSLYMLRAFYPIENKVAEKISYEDFPDFNEHLDESNPLEGKPLYSLALYEQFYEDYEDQLQEFKDLQELEEATE